MTNMNLQILSDGYVRIVYDKYLRQGNYMGFPMLYYGKLNFQIEAFPGAGQDYRAILRSIYRYGEENDVPDFQSVFETSLSVTIEKTFYAKDLSILLNMLIAESENERSGISPFRIDFKKHMEDVTRRTETCDTLKNDPRVKRDLSRAQDTLNHLKINLSDPEE